MNPGLLRSNNDLENLTNWRSENAKTIHFSEEHLVVDRYANPFFWLEFICIIWFSIGQLLLNLKTDLWSLTLKLIFDLSQNSSFGSSLARRSGPSAAPSSTSSTLLRLRRSSSIWYGWFTHVMHTKSRKTRNHIWEICNGWSFISNNYSRFMTGHGSSRSVAKLTRQRLLITIGNCRILLNKYCKNHSNRSTNLLKYSRSFLNRV